MTGEPERPYVSLTETDRPFAEEHHDAVQLLVIDTLRRYTGTLIDVLRRGASVQEMLVCEQVMEKAYFTSLGGQLRLMGVSEVAACLGVSRQQVHNLRKRPDFPPPVSSLECGVIWLAGTIEQYDRERKKTPGRLKKTEKTEEEKTR